MKVSTNELLLALRAPSAGWLAALICALDEALQDPDFGTPQRELVRALIDQGSVPHVVADAANERLTQFERTVEELHALVAVPAAGRIADAPATMPSRPKLTLCGGTA